MAKEIRKNIRFNYFEIKLVADKEILKVVNRKLDKISDIQNKKKKKNYTKKEQQLIDKKKELLQVKNKLDNYDAVDWNMASLLDYYIKKTNIRTDIDLGDYFVEIEQGTLKKHDEITYSFQLTKLRETNLPAKKGRGKKKEDILLNDDEYIGEFVSLIYDPNNHVIMLQSNHYGVSTSKVEQYLTELRRKWIVETLKEDLVKELSCELRVIIDTSKAKSVLDAEIFKKIRVRGADFMLDSFLVKEDSLATARRKIGKGTGLNFDITVSVSSDDKTDTIDIDEVSEIVNKYSELIDTIEDDDSKPLLEVTKRDDEESNLEIINLLNPKLTDLITFKMQVRESVKHEDLFERMKGYYKKRRNEYEKTLDKD